MVDGEYTPTGEVFDIGHTCYDAIVRYGRDWVEPLKCGGNTEMSNGNGSLMRIHPFVLYAYAKEIPFQEWMTMIKCGSMLTHAHERSVVGCLIYAFVLYHLLGTYGAQDLGAFELGLRRAACHLQNYNEISRYERMFKSDFASLPVDEIKSSGYVVDSLEAAIWCVFTTRSYRECVLKAVNLGRDTDTVAGLAGGLAGALYGYDNIPNEWKETLLKRDYIEEMCENAANSWSAK